MDITVLNPYYEIIAIIDSYESLIWTRRYCGFGDFELYLPCDSKNESYLHRDFYLKIEKSNCIMIIEGIEKRTDVEEGTHLIITGRSLESILTRRIVWGQTILNGNLQSNVKDLLSKQLGDRVKDVKRKIANYVFHESIDTKITNIGDFHAQFTGDNLYDAIVSICSPYGLGFKITLSDSNQFVFELYSGKDRTRNREDVSFSPVIFSFDFNTLIQVDNVYSSETLKNVALIAGEGEGVDRKTDVVELPVQEIEKTGLSRRELFVDARDISSKTDDGNLSIDDYKSLLRRRGLEKLVENLPISVFNADPVVGIQYEFGIDYDLGDIVEVESFEDIIKICRITEVTISIDSNGYSVYPYFSEVFSA